MHCFSEISLSSVAQCIKNYNAQKYNESDPQKCKAIMNYHYVKDYLDTFATEPEAE